MNDRSPEYDVIIVGAGAGGGALAWQLSRQRDVRVLLLDAGPRFSADDYPATRQDWERGGFPSRPRSQGEYRFGSWQTLDPAFADLRSWNRVQGAYNRSTARKPLGGGYSHVRGVGGSTLHFTGEAHRLNPQSMRMFSRFGVAADWPLDYAALEPDYQQVEAQLGVAGPPRQGDRWRSAPFPLPAHPLSPASRQLGRGFARLGMGWEANSRAVLSRPSDGRPACNYCGQCVRGCPRGDKSSTDLTFIARALKAGCELRSTLQVVRVEPSGPSRIGSLLAVDGDGQWIRLRARIVVLAAGAVETPRLLLASAGPHAPGGLANASGQVGRHLMETLYWSSAALLPMQVHSYAGLPSDAICWDFNRPDAIDGVVGGCRFSAGVHEDGLDGPVNYATRVVEGWGLEHKQAMREQFGRVVSVGAIGECLPNPQTYVDLDPKARDPHGMPLARIHSYLQPEALARLRFMARTCRKVLKAAGAGQLVEESGSYDLFYASHVFGTCRMGTDPATSVVDANGRCHGWDNLYVTDASVFPSSGGGEAPSLTIQALALRSGRHLRRQLMR